MNKKELEDFYLHLEKVNPLKPEYYRFTEEEIKQRAVTHTIIYKLKGSIERWPIQQKNS